MEAPQLERLATLFKALSDPARLRIVGLLAEQPLAGHALSDRLALTPPTVSHHMRRLVDAGLVDVRPDAQSRIYSLRADALRDWSRVLSQSEPSADTEREEDAVIRAFFAGPTLRQIPASRKKRVVVLRRLLERFQPDRDYPEREVNDLLRAAHPDVATLRRELVDYGFLTRDRGVYRVASELPERGATVGQEVGDECQWFPRLVASAAARAITGPDLPEKPRARRQQSS
jgi:DNA-binding HxlR family transcriptional regulator